MSQTLKRQMHMLRLLPRYPRKKDTATLKAQLENIMNCKVEMRTLQRDLDYYSGKGGFPISADPRSKPYGWSWTGDEAFELTDMDPQTALAFDMAGRFMQRTLPTTTMKYLQPYITRAHNILNTLSDTSEIGQWKNKVKVIPRGIKLIPAETLPEIVDVVYEALLVDKRIQASYQTRNGPLKEYELNPLGLVMRDNTTYLVASVEGRIYAQQFVLHRFKSAELLDSERITPDGFDFDDYVIKEMAYPVNDKKVSLKLRLNSYYARRLIETPLSEDQKDYEVGESVIIEATVLDNLELRWWLQGYGSKVEVLEPASLRNEFAELAKEMSAMYS